MVFELFLKGGPVMFLLLLCSIWGLSIVINQWFFLRQNHFDDSLILDKVKGQLLSSGKESTANSFSNSRHVSSRIIGTAVHLSRSEDSELESGLQRVLDPSISPLEQRLNMLSSIITVAPILGLLGTVLGLMDIFQVISGGGIGQAEALSSGIAQALISTVTGLSVAIPFIFFRQFLSYRLDRFVAKLELISHELVQFCRSHSGVKP